MTVSQASRLWHYTLKLGYLAEVHYTEAKGAPKWHSHGIILRCRRKGSPWFWVWHHREWPQLMRHLRDMDRVEGDER